MAQPQVICLTPIRNEAWILERFLRCASLWADRIIIADQGSDDGSQEIARRFPKVQLIENPAREFNEPERQQLLIAAAREIPGNKLLIALDADEFLTANCLASSEWQLMLRAVPGTVINFQMVNILPNRKTYYLYPTEFSFGYMDDGTPHEGYPVHSPRLPRPDDQARISLRQIKAIHFATMDAPRLRSKLRWYQCWEFLNNRGTINGRWDGSAAALYRDYHREFHVASRLVQPLPDEWVAPYGPDFLGLPELEFYRWDAEVLRMMIAHGTSAFRKLAIWDVDWESMYRRVHGSDAPVKLRDPRSWTDRLVHRWLERTQPAYSHGGQALHWSHRLRHRVLRRCLTLCGW